MDLVAPGVSIYSTIPGGDYETYTGTSMACPMVAGVCALMLSSDPTYSNDEIRTRLTEFAVDRPPAGKDDQFGYGLVHAVPAVKYHKAKPQVLNTVSLISGSPFDYVRDVYYHPHWYERGTDFDQSHYYSYILALNSQISLRSTTTITFRSGITDKNKI